MTRRVHASQCSTRRFSTTIKLFFILPLLILWLRYLIIIISSTSHDDVSTGSKGALDIPRNTDDASLSSPTIPRDRRVILMALADDDRGLSIDPRKGPTTQRPIVIAYTISLIKCSDHQSSTPGLLDAATILRHSVHKTSIHTPGSGSRYDYKLYAIVHSLASQCGHVLSDLGYELLLRDSPVKISEIRGEYLRKNIHKEWCCGADEFVKLYAYTLTRHPIVVHTDIDFMYHRPMDDIFDAMLMPHDSAGGKQARSRIETEYPNVFIPDNIEAYLTRDYHQVIPGRKAGTQIPILICPSSIRHRRVTHFLSLNLPHTQLFRRASSS